MRALVLAVLLVAGCDDAAFPDGDGAAAADLSVVVDLAVEDLTAPPVDLSATDTRPCGQPEQQCCVGDGGHESCDPNTAVCNPFGVCVACGLYPLSCCPGETCLGMQTCLTIPQSGSYCFPCGHPGQACCFTGDPCGDGGTCSDDDGGSSPVCLP